jgi:limonene-1,2-epoxide hydrolase
MKMSTAMSNSDVITAFCEVWAEKDLDRIMGFFTEDAVYHNIPMDPANVGKDQIRAVIESFTTAPESIEFIVHHQAENADGLVMNERTDVFKFGDSTIRLRVMGTFELTDGKISAWRDYFDIQQYMSQLPQQA